MAGEQKREFPKVSRRHFAKMAAAGSLFTILPRHVLGGPEHTAPSEKTTVALVGCGGQGHVLLPHFLSMKDVQVVAVCDVYREGGGYISTNWERGDIKKVCGREPARKLVEQFYADDRGLGHFRGCAVYADYRELLDREDIDGVIVATPDHTHAVISMAVLKRKRHLYCEKPLAYSLQEIRTLVEAARDAGVATQLGNHGQADENSRLVQEYLLDDAIGPVREVHVKRQGLWWDPPAAPPSDTPPVPDGLDWDLWLGPAQGRPYHPDYHPWHWRDHRVFGTGTLGDLGCHILSSVFKALKLGHPISIDADFVQVHPEIYPRNFKVSWEYPQRGDLPPVRLTWFNEGYEAPRPKSLEPKRNFNSGTVFYGDAGTLMGIRLIPETRMRAYGKPPQKIPRSPGHYREWIDACRGGPPAGSDIVKHGGILTETPLLGNIAIQTGKKLQWDGPGLKITNDTSANDLVHREYRSGWTL